jgi:hypothetical protein
MLTLNTPLFRTCWVCLYSVYLLKPFRDFELHNIQELEANQQEDDKVYYEESNLSWGIEGIDYIIEYGVNSEDEEDEA